MPGAGGEGTNPEQLFSAGYAACFDSALNLAARKQRTKIGEIEVKAQVSIGKDNDGGLTLTVALDVKIPGGVQEVAAQLVDSPIKFVHTPKQLGVILQST